MLNQNEVMKLRKNGTSNNQIARQISNHIDDRDEREACYNEAIWLLDDLDCNI